MNDILFGLWIGLKDGSCVFGALAILVYQARSDEIKTGSRESLSYFEFVMFYVPISVLLVCAERATESLSGKPVITIISAAMVFVLFLVTCVFVVIREVKRERDDL